MAMLFQNIAGGRSVLPYGGDDGVEQGEDDDGAGREEDYERMAVTTKIASACFSSIYLTSCTVFIFCTVASSVFTFLAPSLILLGALISLLSTISFSRLRFRLRFFCTTVLDRNTSLYAIPKYIL